MAYYTYMAHTYPTYNYIIGGTQSRTGNSKQYGELGELEAVRGTGGTAELGELGPVP